MILDLKNATSWDTIVDKGLEIILGHSYSDTVKKNAEKVQYRDSETEACNLFAEQTSRERLIEAVTNEISNNFNEVLVYHACRTNRVNDYYKNGIVPLSPIEAQEQFRDCFSDHVSQDDIDTAIAAVSLKTRDEVVHAVLDGRVFIDSSGHYLIYGGEYQNSLSINLPGASELTRDILKGIGKATVFVCRLPFSTVTNLESLASFMMSDYFFRIAHNRNEVNVIDYTVTLKETISPDAIVRHYCPIRIRDPYKQYAVWNDETMEYE